MIMRTYVTTLIGIISLVSFHAPGYAKNKTTIDQLQPPPFPLPALKANEKLARLEFLLDTQNYHSTDFKSPMTTEDCSEILENLKSSNHIKILEPDIVAESRDDPRIPEDFIRHCPRVEIDRVWYSWKAGSLSHGVDPQFDQLPLDKKDDYADYYYKKNGPIELYNLGQFFNGKPIWGTFAGDGLVVCNNDRNLCSNLEGYRLRNGTVIGTVIDISSCAPYLSSNTQSSGRIVTNTKYPYSFRESPSFSSFIEIDHVPYRVGLNTTIPWGEFYRLLNEGSTSLIVEPVKKNGGLCIFETKQH